MRRRAKTFLRHRKYLKSGESIFKGRTQYGSIIFLRSHYNGFMCIICHLDLDAFFASVEERDKEWLRGKPIVVGADPNEGKGRGVVSTANYKAREYGIHSAMPISKAWQLSETARKKGYPPAEFLGVDFARYSETSERVMEIIRKYSSKIEQASIDEAYFEINSKSEIQNPKQIWENAEKIAKSIKTEIKVKERITASIGIGPNKLIAKIASDFKKPDGLTIIQEEDAEKFLEPMLIRKIPGIGPKTELLFSKKGIKTVKDLKRFSEAELYELLGKWGLELYEKIRGRDDSPLIESVEAKSIGEQETFDKDTSDPAFIMSRLEALCQGVFSRFLTEGFTNFLTVVITVRFADFETKSRARTFSKPPNDFKILYFEAMKMFMPFLDGRENLKQKLIRLIGVRRSEE